jgi:hypothetical protein
MAANRPAALRPAWLGHKPGHIALAVVAVALGACQVCSDPVPAKPLRRGESSLRDYLEQHLHHRLVPAPMNASAWLGRPTLPKSIPSSSLANWVARSTR